MKRIISVIMTLTLCGVFCSCENKKVSETSKYVYDVLNLGEIALGMWVTPPSGFITEQNYKKISESGINVVNGFGYSEQTDEDINKVLDYCEKYNMKYLFSSLGIEEKIKEYKETGNKELINSSMSIIDKFANSPAYAGQLFIDEPSVVYFDALKAFISAYKEKYPDKLSYVNMLPYYALGGTGASSYEDYVGQWMEKLNPNFYSYDSYPLVDYDQTAEGYQAELSDFYYNLDLLRVKTREKGIPLWTFVATLAYTTNGSEPNRRNPSREDLRWEVFSNLAFGAKGIQYFCYWTPSDTFGNAMVNRVGETTERYDYVKEVNSEFNEYGKMLLNSNADGVMICDNRRNGYDIYSSSLTNFGNLKGVEGNRYVIGCFSDKDTGNKSLLISPTTPRDDIDITLNFAKGVKEVTAYVKGVKTKLTVTDRNLNLHINKGDAVFIQL